MKRYHQPENIWTKPYQLTNTLNKKTMPITISAFAQKAFHVCKQEVLDEYKKVVSSCWTNIHCNMFCLPLYNDDGEHEGSNAEKSPLETPCSSVSL